MRQHIEDHFSGLLVQIHLIGWVHILRLEFEGGPLVVCDHFGVWYLCLKESHVHPALFCDKCRQQHMLRSRRLLLKLSVSTSSKSLILFLNHLILLENAQLGPSLAWLSV